MTSFLRAESSTWRPAMATIDILHNVIEWFLALKAFTPPQVVQASIEDMVRYQIFEEEGATHTCCSARSRFWKNEMTAEDRVEIWEEEEEIIGAVGEKVKIYCQSQRPHGAQEWAKTIVRRARYLEEEATRVADDAQERRSRPRNAQSRDEATFEVRHPVSHGTQRG